MNEYVIVNKTEMENEIAELKEELKKLSGTDGFKCYGKIIAYEKALTKSTPLIPEIEKAFDAGQFEEYGEVSFDGGENYETIRVTIEKQEYISNLKIDI